MQKANVLFLCTGNSARSQMAEAFLRRYAGERFNVYSAGLEPKGIHPLTVRVLEEAGFDLSQHTSDSVKKYMGHMHFRYVITVCAHADENCPTPLWHLGEKLHLPFDDPAAATGSEAERLAVFRRVRDEIGTALAAWVQSLAPEQAAP
ncbi:MAG: arsenate reductase ArsC [Anaerolineae bacterium]|jgi:arsenate reductase|nr:arsenate reductase ArsC [Anaerolineae bacterium]